MPIRPERKHLYPANWKSEIVPMIRARSGDSCEACGVKNKAQIQRHINGYNWRYVGSDEVWGIHGTPIVVREPIRENLWNKPVKVVLTVAHLNHDETDNRPENLEHLCQLHHNRHDAKHRAANRKARLT